MPLPPPGRNHQTKAASFAFRGYNCPDSPVSAVVGNLAPVAPDPSRSASRLYMGMLLWPLILWGAITAALVILLIYRSTLSMHEDEQLFLSESESQMQKDHIEVMQKLNKITPIVKWLGAASGVLILIIGGVALYQQLSQMN